jgi:hypothetical protein
VPVEKINENQLRRSFRRIRNLISAGLSEKQTKAYTAAASEAFARIVTEQERSHSGEKANPDRGAQ